MITVYIFIHAPQGTTVGPFTDSAPRQHAFGHALAAGGVVPGGFADKAMPAGVLLRESVRDSRNTRIPVCSRDSGNARVPGRVDGL